MSKGTRGLGLGATTGAACSFAVGRGIVSHSVSLDGGGRRCCADWDGLVALDGELLLREDDEAAAAVAGDGSNLKLVANLSVTLSRITWQPCRRMLNGLSAEPLVVVPKNVELLFRDR